MSKTLDQIIEHYSNYYKGERSADIAEACDISVDLAASVLMGLFDYWVSCVAADPLQTTQTGLDARRRLGWIVVSNPWLCL